MVSYSERTHSLHCDLHAVYSLILSYLHCRILMLNFIPSESKLFKTDSLSALLPTCCLFSYPVVPSLSYFHSFRRQVILNVLTLYIVTYMLSILLPCRTFTVIFWCLISFLQEVSYSELTHSLHYYLHAVYSLTLLYLHCCILMLNFILFSQCRIFLQSVSFAELTHSRLYYVHAVYSLTVLCLHCHVWMN